MKSGNTLRAARNSLLCCFMALAASFLVACGGGGGGGGSVLRDITNILDPGAPGAPGAPSATARSESEIEVTWSAVSRATSYKLYRSTSSGGTYSLVASNIFVLRYLDSRRSASTKYFYQLEACNIAGCSSRSPEVSATTQSPPVAPARPPMPSASAQSDTEIEVTWSAVSGATSYKLYRSPSGGRAYDQIGGDISALRYLDRRRSPNTEYFYQLEACNRGGCSARSPAGSVTTQAQAQAFSTYLEDAAVEGAEYSGPTGNGLTGEGGVFPANEGVFEFSIGGTTLGSVRLNSDWADSHVTPADFIGVDEEKVIDIARIMQGLDGDGDPENGISISQSVRENALDLFPRVDSNDAEFPVVIGGETFMIPPKDEATDHFVATRKCLFSGGYVGDFEGTRLSDNSEVRGQSYYAVEPFVNRVRRFTNGRDDNNFESFGETSTVGVIGSTITLSPGNELSFVTPGLVAGEWQYPNDGGDVISSGTENLTFAADTGNPGATRRIVGVETTDAVTVAGMYVLDYFEEATVFRGRYYDVDATLGVSSAPLSLTIVGGGSWPAAAGMTTTLTLSGTLGGDDTAVTVEVVRKDENYGSFEGGVGTQELSGTWCDIGGAIGVAVLPPPVPRAFARSKSEIEITWNAVSGATSYKLYRSTSRSGGYAQIGGDISALRYLDRGGLSPDTEYFYQLEACNSAGCSVRSPADSDTTLPMPVAPAQPAQPRASAQSESEILVTWSAVSGATRYKLYRSTSRSGGYAQIGGDISALRYSDRGRSASTEYFYRLEACNSVGCSAPSPEVSVTIQDTPLVPGQCRRGQMLTAGESCDWKGITFAVNSGGRSATFGNRDLDESFDAEYIFTLLPSGIFVVERTGTVWEITQLG